MKNPRVLILMPVRDAHDSLPTVLESLDRLDPQPDGYVFCENNSTDESLKIIAKFKHPKRILRYWLRDDAPFRYGSERVAIARQFLLITARKTNPDFAVFIDADMCCDSVDLLRVLTDHNADVLGGLYMRWMPPGIFPAPTQLPAYVPFNALTADLHYPLEECFAVGAGCLAMKRQVVNDVRLNFDDPPRYYMGKTMPEDISYTWNAYDLGYRVCVAKNVLLDHLKPYGAMRPWD